MATHTLPSRAKYVVSVVSLQMKTDRDISKE